MDFLLVISLIGTVVVFAFVAVILRLVEREPTASSESQKVEKIEEKPSLQNTVLQNTVLQNTVYD